MHNYLDRIPEDTLTHIYMIYFKTQVLNHITSFKQKQTSALFRQNANTITYPPSPFIGWPYMLLDPIQLTHICKSIDPNISLLHICQLFYMYKNSPQHPAYREYWIHHRNYIKAVIFTHDSQDCT